MSSRKNAKAKKNMENWAAGPPVFLPNGVFFGLFFGGMFGRAAQVVVVVRLVWGAELTRYSIMTRNQFTE
jgi:hypothetical protein